MTIGATANAGTIQPDWLTLRREDALDPGQRVIDAHHHLYDRAYLTYLLPDYLADLSSGHEVEASVVVQARAMLRAEGPEAMRAIGETEFVNGVAAMSASGFYGNSRVCAGIVGFADLTIGDAVAPILERHIVAGGSRFRGIRQTLCWDVDAALLNPVYPTVPSMSRSDAFRAGFARLGAMGLSFDAWCFFPQADDIVELARRFPEVSIVVNHCGGVVRIRGYADMPDLFECWRDGIKQLAACSNVSIKLSGLGMRLSGFGFEDGASPPGSEALAAAWKPWMMHCLECFGADRCMWGSNFPVDKSSYAYGIGLNAVKRLLVDASASERDAVLRGTAKRVYRLAEPAA